MCLSLKQYLSVADNARDVVLIHVSASSEGQESRNERGAMTKTTERHILTHGDACGLLPVLLYRRTFGSASYILHYTHTHTHTHTH
jgi:hypothetical protein